MSGGKSQQSSQNQQQSGSSTFVDQSQQPFLDFLRQQGQQLATDQLGGGSQFQQGIVNPSFQAFQNQIGGDSQLLQQQISGLQGDVTENLQQNLLPSIGGGAAALGQRGSSRHGVAEGIALRDAGRQQSRIATDLTSDANRRQLSALSLAPSIGGLGFQPLQNLAGIIGGPNNLASSFGSGSGSGQGTSKSLGF